MGFRALMSYVSTALAVDPTIEEELERIKEQVGRLLPQGFSLLFFINFSL